MLRFNNLKGRSNPVRKRSVVWRFFKTINTESVQCLLCSGYLSRHEQGSTTAMLRHLRVKHPKEVLKKCKDLRPETSSGHPGPGTDGEQVCSVEMTLEDGDLDNPVTVIKSDINLDDGIMQGALAERMTHDDMSDDRPVTHKGQKRSLIWRYFHLLCGLDAARCHICTKKIQCYRSGATSNLRRHLSKRHLEAYSELVANERSGQPSNLTASSNAKSDTLTSPETVGATEQRVFSVDVSLEDGDSGSPTTVNQSNFHSAFNGSEETAQGGKGERMKHEAGNDEQHLIHGRHTRSLIWRHFERLETLDAARCLICSKKLQRFESGGTSNLRRHMSNRHPEVFSTLIEGRNQQPSNVALSLNANGETAGSTEHKVFSVSDGEKRVLRRERELIEALRRAQKEEAQALEHQRELLEKLRVAAARETAAEREKIESLRKAQQEEAQDLSKQREELQKEKAELQKKLEKLQEENFSCLPLDNKN